MAMSEDHLERMYTVRYVADMFSVTSETVRTWITNGRLSATRINGHWRIPHSDLQKFARSRYTG